jgi:transposase-like protein
MRPVVGRPDLKAFGLGRFLKTRLCQIDGGRGLRRALADVLGDLALVQRCVLHKKRNLLAHLPQYRHAHVSRALSEA